MDMDDGLKRVGGSMALYKKLLGRFSEGNFLDSIDTALQSGDMAEAAKQIHTLKGVSANLSLERVRALSVKLEAEVKAGEDHAGSYSELKLAYADTLEKLKEVDG
jgi:HPt (histidine-containing phosphotransfer) domain-containing protein